MSSNTSYIEVSGKNLKENNGVEMENGQKTHGESRQSKGKKLLVRKALKRTKQQKCKVGFFIYIM